MVKQNNCLFVCTGNTCRSQMAHALMQQYADQQGLQLAVDSAGIRANVGSPTTPFAVTVLQEQGILWQGASQQLSQTQLRWADRVWVMTHEHLAVVQQLQQDLLASERSQVELVLGDEELADPLDCGKQAYDQVLASLQQRLPKLLAPE